MKLIQIAITDSPSGSAIFALDSDGRLWRSYSALTAKDAQRAEWMPVALPFQATTAVKGAA